MIYTRNLNTPATYFPPAGQDGFGKPMFGAAVPCQVRWQQKMDLIRDADGNEVRTTDTVYVSEYVATGGRIGRGDLTSPDGLQEIRQVGVSPSLRPGLELVKVWL